MANNGSSGVPNGMPAHLSHRPQTPAYTIGNQFVTQFYHVLVTQPEYLHRFYTDDSTLTHSDSGTESDQPSSVTVSTQKDIRLRVADMGFKDAKTDIWSVDSQYSAQSGVLVLVTGSIYPQGKKKRDFVESFFLAPQEKGYYVLNDQLRFVSDRSAAGKDSFGQHSAALQASMYHQPQPAAVPPYYQNAQPAQYATPYQNSTASSHASQTAPVPIRSTTVTPPAGSQYSPQKPVATPAAPVDQPAPEQKPAEAPKPVEAAPPAPKPVAPPAAKVEEPKPVQAAPEPAKKAEEAEKKVAPAAVATKSTQTPAEEPKQAPAEQKPAEPAVPLTYADRLRMTAQKGTPASRPATSQPRPAQLSSPARPTTAPQVAPAANGVKAPEPTGDTPASGVENTDANAAHPSTSTLKEEDIATSVFVRNLPEETTPEKLLEVLSQFGTIKGGLKGISLKAKGRGAEFAFVDYEDASSVQAAKSAKVEIDGKQISVVERRPQLARGSGSYAPRGGRGDGRGGGFRGRNDGRGGRGITRENRPHTTGGARSEARPEGGRGRGYEGRGLEGGRGRGGDRGRGRYNGAAGGRNGPSQPSAAPQQQPTAA